MAFTSLVIIILILLNGFFVAAEFALIGSPRALIDQYSSKGHTVARVVQDILRNPLKQDRYIATAQLGITLASLGLGMYGEHKLSEWLAPFLSSFGLASYATIHTVSGVLAIGILTYLHIVIGEMVPKSMALQKPHQMVFWLTPLMIIIQKSFSPLVTALNSLGNFMLRLMGVKRIEGHGSAAIHSAEELQFVFKESQDGGQLRRGTREVLQDLLHFGHTTAGEVMVPRIKIVGIPLGASGMDVRALIHETRHTRYPFYENNFDNIIGFIHTKDFLRPEGIPEIFDREFARAVPYVPESSSLEQVLKVMRKQNAHMVVVIDEFGGTAGILSLEDLFEEVVGEIGEGAGDSLDFTKDKLDKKLYHVKGLVRLDDLGQKLERNLTNEDVDTVSGLIMSKLGRLPQLGDAITYRGLRFEVTSVEGHGVERCTVKQMN